MHAGRSNIEHTPFRPYRSMGIMKEVHRVAVRNLLSWWMQVG